jgi:hypothetical protein
MSGSMSGKKTTTGWNVTYSTKAKKQFESMPEKIREKMTVLAKEISVSGPIRKNCNYSPPLIFKKEENRARTRARK